MKRSFLHKPIVFWILSINALATAQEQYTQTTIPFHVSYPAGKIVTTQGTQTWFLPPVTSAEYEITQIEWDFDGDGLTDVSLDTYEPVHYTFPMTGVYLTQFTAMNYEGDKAQGKIKVIVADPKAPNKPTMPAGLMSQSNDTFDGNQNVYALIVSTPYWPSIDTMVQFYDMLTKVYDVDPNMITYLVIADEIPIEHADKIDGIATPDNFSQSLFDLGQRADLDDTLIVNVECHGRGYIGKDVTEAPYNVAFHGYCDIKPLVNQTGNGDEFDFRESEYELSLFCGGGTRTSTKPYWDFHAGLDEWVVYWQPTSSLRRWMFTSHYENVYVEGLGYISDNSEDIDKLTDYALGDFNQNGQIETDLGEVWDYDNDGILPYDRETGIFDEDDWGPIDAFQNNMQYFHSPLIDIPYDIFDDNLDNTADIDVYPGTVREVDGTDANNDGCIDGIDLNDDGDMDDWVAINETICLRSGEITDDEVTAVMDLISCGTKIFITNTCHGGGFVNDLSEPNSITMAGCYETGVASAGFFPELLNEAFSIYPYEADTNGNGDVSIMEAFNHAGDHPHVGCTPGMDLFQYDDNGDRVSHMYVLPNGGDGMYGSTIYLTKVYAGDFEPDGDIDSIDLEHYMSHWLDNGCQAANSWCNKTDINHSNSVDLRDFSLMVSNWLIGTEP